MLLGLVTCQIQDAIFVFPKGATFQDKSRYFSGGIVWLALTYSCCAIALLIVSLLWSDALFIAQNALLIFLYLSGFGLQSYFQQFCRATDHMPLYAIIGLSFTLASVIVALLWLPADPRGVVIVYSQLVGFAVSLVVAIGGGRLWRYWTLRWNDCRPYLGKMLKYSLPIIPTAFMWWAVMSLNRPFLSHCASLSSVGIFAAAQKVPSVVFMCWGVLGNAWQISVLEEWHSEDFISYFKKILSAFTVVVSFLCFVGTVLSPIYMRYFVGKDFYQAYKYVPLLLLGSVLSVLGGVLGTVFMASQRSKYFLYSSLWMFAITVLLDMALIPKFGLMGASAAITVAFGAEFLSRLAYARKILRTNLMRIELLGLSLCVFQVLFFTLANGSIRWVVPCLLFLFQGLIFVIPFMRARKAN